MKKFSAILFLLLASACTTPEQIEAARQEQERQDVETCREYGFRFRTDAFSNCMLQLSLERQRRYDSYYYGGGYYGRPYGSGIYYMNRF